MSVLVRRTLKTTSSLTTKQQIKNSAIFVALLSTFSEVNIFSQSFSYVSASRVLKITNMYRDETIHKHRDILKVSQLSSIILLKLQISIQKFGWQIERSLHELNKPFAWNYLNLTITKGGEN